MAPRAAGSARGRGRHRVGGSRAAPTAGPRGKDARGRRCRCQRFAKDFCPPPFFFFFIIFLSNLTASPPPSACPLGCRATWFGANQPPIDASSCHPPHQCWRAKQSPSAVLPREPLPPAGTQQRTRGSCGGAGEDSFEHGRGGRAEPARDRRGPAAPPQPPAPSRGRRRCAPAPRSERRERSRDPRPPSAPASRSIPLPAEPHPAPFPLPAPSPTPAARPLPAPNPPRPQRFPSLPNPRLPNPSQILPRAPSLSPGHAAALAARSAPTFWVLLGLLLLVVLHDSRLLRRARGKRKNPRAETALAAPSQVRAALRSATRPPW